MRPDLRPLAAGAVVVVALVVPVLLVARTLPPRTVTELVVPGPEGVAPVRLQQSAPSVQRLEVDTPRFSPLRRARVQVQVATYTRRPTQPIQLLLRGSRGEQLGTCRIPPSDYVDNGYVACPVERPDRLRRVEIEVPGRAPFAVYAAAAGGRLVAGSLVRKDRLGGLSARLRLLRDRVAVTRPVLVSPIILFVLLALSIGLFGAALLVGTDPVRKQ